jgi:hypothetical protein
MFRPQQLGKSRNPFARANGVRALKLEVTITWTKKMFRPQQLGKSRNPFARANGVRALKLEVTIT